jgi:hypothetical protein
MRNRWTKRSPFLSIWLSGANAVWGAARGRASAEGKRQAAAMMSEAAKQTVRFWTDALVSPPPRKKRKTR